MVSSSVVVAPSLFALLGAPTIVTKTCYDAVSTLRTWCFPFNQMASGSREVDESNIETTTFFAAQIHNIQAMAALAALILSFLLLALYKGAVRRSMHRSAINSQPQRDYAVPDQQVKTSLPPTITLIHGSSEPADQTAVRLARSALAGPWWNLLVYAVAGVTFGVAMSGLYILAGATPFSWSGLLFLSLQNAAPLVLTAALVKSFSWRTSAALVAAALLLTVAPESLSEEYPHLFAGLRVDGVAAATFGALIYNYLVLLRPIRAIGPMVFAFTSALMFGFVALTRGIGDPSLSIQEVYLSSVTAWVAHFGIDPGWARLALTFGTLSIAGLTGWLFQRGVGTLYERGLVSDQSLTIDLVWLFAAIASGATLSRYDGHWLLYALGVFLLYKFIAVAGHSLVWKRQAADVKTPNLLLLRVFSTGKEKRTLFEAFSEPWRFAGRTQMIAGPDLAGSTVEPHEFLEFIGGHLSRRFISSEAELNVRLAETRLERDADGRYRVADFFCHDDTWKLVLQNLVRNSDAVLMDLRGFGPANKGCVFEIHDLLAVLPIERVVFVVGKDTDEQFLQSVLAEGLAALPASAANRKATDVMVFPLDARRDVRNLVVAVAMAMTKRNAPHTVAV